MRLDQKVHSGKSAIIRRHVHNFFSDSYRSTVGVDFHLKIVPYNEELEVRMQLWDIAGQVRSKTINHLWFILLVTRDGEDRQYSTGSPHQSSEI